MFPISCSPVAEMDNKIRIDKVKNACLMEYVFGFSVYLYRFHTVVFLLTCKINLSQYFTLFVKSLLELNITKVKILLLYSYIFVGSVMLTKWTMYHCFYLLIIKSIIITHINIGNWIKAFLQFTATNRHSCNLPN